MIRDATATRQIAAERHPDSRWSAFAQGVRMMAGQTIEVNQVTVRIVGAIAAFIAVAGTLVAVTVWLTNLSHRADTATTLASAIEDLTKAQARQEGKIDTLVSMQGDLARTTAEISGLKSRLDAQDRRLETMDAWIQTTRDRLQEQGFRGVPDYKPGGAP